MRFLVLQGYMYSFVSNIENDQLAQMYVQWSNDIHISLFTNIGRNVSKLVKRYDYKSKGTHWSKDTTIGQRGTHIGQKVPTLIKRY